MRHFKLFEEFSHGEVLYHGSKKKLDLLHPHPSMVVDGEPVVFATNERWLALFFAAGVSHEKIECGISDDQPYIGECYAGAFSLLHVPGYLHTIKAVGFHSDPRLGMQGSEFIKSGATEIVSAEYVESLFEALQGEHVNLLKADDLQNFLDGNL